MEGLNAQDINRMNKEQCDGSIKYCWGGSESIQAK